MNTMKKFYGFTLLTSLLLNSSALCTNVLKDDNNISSVRALQNSLGARVTKIQKKIDVCYEDADFEKLLDIHAEFRDIKAQENQWQEVAHDLKAYKWLGQNWYQTVAGHLFFPDHIHKLLEAPVTEYLIKRNDRIWALAISAYYQNPLGQYYLAESLIMKEVEDTDSDFFNNLYKNSLTTFSKCLDHNDACYALGKSKMQYPYRGKDYSQESATGIFSKGTDFKNQFENVFWQDLNLKKGLYLALGKQGYGPAYREIVSEFSDDDLEKINLLNKAIELEDFVAFIYLGGFYEQQNNRALVKEYYFQAANKGISDGYIEWGIYLTGDLEDSKNDKKLNTLSEETLEEAAQYFILAGQAKDPQGWEHLLMLEQKRKTKNSTKNIQLASAEIKKLLPAKHLYLQIQEFWNKLN